MSSGEYGHLHAAGRGVRDRQEHAIARECEQECVLVVRDDGMPEKVGLELIRERSSEERDRNRIPGFAECSQRPAQ